jgi:hypothetical protein
MKFLRKTKLCDLAPIDANTIKNSIKGINKTVNKIRRRAYRSNNAKYALPREEKVERLQLILIDLKSLL